jgi:multicomponent Na+:H+ antiporter subunit E
MADRGHGRRLHLQAFGLRWLMLVCVWWVLVTDLQGLGFGLAVAAAAAGVSLWLSPPARHCPRPLRLPAFAGFFLYQSLLAGWDVARRTLHPALPLQPEILHLRLALPVGAPTWWLMLTTTLLPGTLSVRLHRHQVLEVHCLDARQDVRGSVRETERRIARLFGLDALRKVEEERPA